MSDKEEILVKIALMDTGDIKVVAEEIHEILKRRSKSVGRKLRVGQRVNVVRNGRVEFSGTIRKVNRTRAAVDREDGRGYAVPFSMIEAVEV